MLDIALLIFFFVMAYRIAKAIYRETEIFKEFKQPRTLAFLVMLFPFGPIIQLVGAARLPFPLTFVGAAACYIPAFFIARRLGLVLEIADTDRVKGARDAISHAFGTALAGLIYVALILIFTLAVTAIG